MPVEPPAELVERLRAELPRAAGARGSAGSRRELDLDARSCSSPAGSTGSGEATVAAGAERLAAANVIANRLAGTDGGAVDAARAGEARRGARPDPARGARRGARARSASPASRPAPYLAAGGRLGHRRARADRRADPRGEPGPGRGLPRRQGGPARLLRRPGDEGDRRQGEPARRQRARAREAPGSS